MILWSSDFMSLFHLILYNAFSQLSPTLHLPLIKMVKKENMKRIIDKFSGDIGAQGESTIFRIIWKLGSHVPPLRRGRITTKVQLHRVNMNGDHDLQPEFWRGAWLSMISSSDDMHYLSYPTVTIILNILSIIEVESTKWRIPHHGRHKGLLRV